MKITFYTQGDKAKGELKNKVREIKFKSSVKDKIKLKIHLATV